MKISKQVPEPEVIKAEPVKKKKAPEMPNYFLEELKNHPVQEGVEIRKSNIDSIYAL